MSSHTHRLQRVGTIQERGSQIIFMGIIKDDCIRGVFIASYMQGKMNYVCLSSSQIMTLLDHSLTPPPQLPSPAGQ